MLCVFAFMNDESNEANNAEKYWTKDVDGHPGKCKPSPSQADNHRRRTSDDYQIPTSE